MIVLSNLTAQTIAPGQAVTFDKVVLKSGCCECFNSQLPRSVKLRNNGIWSLGFGGNVTVGTAGDTAQLAIAVGNQPLVETAMSSTPSAANALNHVYTETRFRVCCDDLNRVSVVNTGAVPVILAPNSAFVLDRRS